MAFKKSGARPPPGGTPKLNLMRVCDNMIDDGFLRSADSNGDKGNYRRTKCKETNCEKSCNGCTEIDCIFAIIIQNL